MKRGLAGVAIVGAVAVLTAACADRGSGGSEEGAVSGSVTMWSYPIGVSGEKGYWDSLIEEFEGDHPDIDVEVIVHPWQNRDEKLVTAIAGGQAPDVVYLIPDQIPGYVDEGTLAAVGDVVADERGDFRPSALEALTVDGKLYGVPLLQAIYGTVYFSSAVENLGLSEDDLPTTWDELLKLGERAKAAGYYLTTYNGAHEASLNTSLYPLLWQAGGEVLTADNTELSLDTDAGRRALELINTLADNGYVPHDELAQALSFEQSAVGKGKVLMSYASSWTQLSAHYEPDDVIVAPPMKDEESVAFGTVGGLSILESSDNKEAAAAWINFLTSDENIASFNKDVGYHTPRHSTGPLYTDVPVSGEEEKYLDQTRVGVLHPKGRELMGVIRPHIQAMLLEGVSVTDTIEAATSDANALLGRG